MVIDILDVTGSFLNNCRDLIGGNPAVVVATKLDLLPKGTDPKQVAQWLERFISYKRFSCLAAHVVSNKTGLYPYLHLSAPQLVSSRLHLIIKSMLTLWCRPGYRSGMRKHTVTASGT
jgi:hypothetical protein